ncbi:hypothetical protein SLA2020_146710 [Shorea laevis]
MKKAAAKGSKAEQKAKKKQVEEEIPRLSAKLKEKHAEELSSLGYSTSSENEKNNLDNLVKAIAGVPVANQPDYSKLSKSAKRREKRAQQEAAREQRIQEDQNNIVSERMIEDEELVKKLEPLGLTINEIKPDGHYLYRAVEDQLTLLSRGSFLDVEMGKEYKAETVSDSLKGSIMLSYHRHAFGLGEHYNSVVPNVIR